MITISAKGKGLAYEENSKVSNVLEILREGLASKEMSPTLTGMVLSTESLNSTEERSYTNTLATVDTAISSAITESGLFGETVAEEELSLMVASANAAAYGALMAVNPTETLGNKIAPYVSSDSMHVVRSEGFEGVTTRQTAIEAYDDKATDNMVSYTATFNLFAPNPGDIVRSNFPVITIDPSQTGLRITANLLYVQEDTPRETSGAPSDFNRRNLIRATVDPTILQPDVTRITPVVRTESLDKFADPANLAPRTITVHGTDVLTAPLVFGKRMDLIALSQNDKLLADGVMGFTDQLDVDIQLETVYIKVGDDIIAMSTKGITTSRFVASRQEAATGMNLNFSSDHMLINGDKEDVDQSPLVTLVSIAGNDLTVRIRMSISGSTDVDTGTLIAHGTELEVVKVYNAAKEEVPLDVAPAAALVTLFESAEFLGYELYATRSNTNLRQRGHIVGNTSYTEEYFVGIGSPITAVRPINTTRDSSDLRALIASSHIRMQGEAVSKLVETANTLRDITTTGILDDYPEVLGIGRLYIRPLFIEEYLDVAAHVMNENSFNTIRDVAALMFNVIRDTTSRLYVESNMGGAKAIVNPGATNKTTAVVSTSPYIASYLQDYTNKISFKDDLFDFKIVSDVNAELHNLMFITLHQIDETRNTAPNVLSFGITPWMPDVVFNVNLTTTGQHSRELCVHPRHKSIVICPVMGLIHVRNITEALGKKCLCLIDEIPLPISQAWTS